MRYALVGLLVLCGCAKPPPAVTLPAPAIAVAPARKAIPRATRLAPLPGVPPPLYVPPPPPRPPVVGSWEAEHVPQGSGRRAPNIEEARQEAYIEGVKQRVGTEGCWIGMTPEEVIIGMGLPENSQEFITGREHQVYWYYGSWQFVFQAGKLTAMNQWGGAK